MVCQDRWFLMAVVSQDRFYCSRVMWPRLKLCTPSYPQIPCKKSDHLQLHIVGYGLTDIE